MNFTSKIIAGILVPLAFFGGYWFFIRNREPFLDLDKTDWLNNIAIIKFGNNTKSVSLGNNGQMNAGSTYSDKYKLEFTSKNKLMIFIVKEKNGNIVNKQTLDFGAKIKY